MQGTSTSANSEPVLVTGSSGRIGRAVVAELQRRGIAVRGFDRVPTPGIADMVIGDLVDPLSLQRASAGARTLIHLAATPDDADFLGDLVPNNIVGVYHVLESARSAGVRRLVLASTGQVVWYERFRGPYPLKVETLPTPRYWYAACKLFLEGAGRAYAEAHGLSVIVARLGWCPRTPEQEKEIADNAWAQDLYLSPGDAGRFFAQAVSASADLRFALVYASSKPRLSPCYDLAPARTAVGYEPCDTWPEGLEG